VTRMKPDSWSECEILAAAHVLIKEEHDRFMMSPHTSEDLHAHIAKLRMHKRRVQDLIARLKQPSREHFFTEAALASDPSREMERLARSEAAILRAKRPARASIRSTPRGRRTI